MPRVGWLAVSSMLAVALGACWGPRDEASAAPGDACGGDGSARCLCADGAIGRATCDDEGVVGVCVCGDDRQPPSAGTSGTSTGSADVDAGSDSGPSAGSGDSGAVLDECTTSPLRLQVLDADYSGALDRLVLLASAPDAVALVDPATLDVVSIELPLVGSSLSVAPDGLSAAVAHNGFVSIVDLASESLSNTIATTTVAGDVVLGGNGFAYLLPESDQWVDIHSVEIATEIDHGNDSMWSIYAGTLAKLHASGEAVYGITVGLSPTDIERYDVAGGPVAAVSDSQYHGDYPMCGDLFMSADGARVFTGCGTAFRTSPGTTEDMTYNGALEAPPSSDMFSYGPRYQAIVHDATNDKVYAIPGSQSVFGGDPPDPAEASVQTFSYEFLSFDGSRPIPCMAADSNAVTAYGRFVFAAADGASIYVLARAEGFGLLYDWGLAVLPVE